MRFNDGHPNIVTLAGIRSTGLTSSITTAQHVLRRMNFECGLALARNPQAVDSRPDSKWPGWYRRPFEDRARLAIRADYGRIVCSCENISRGEIQDTLAACPGIATLDGLKRRTRALTGRCQGFNCCVPIAEMVRDHYRVPLSSVTKRGPGTEVIARQIGTRHIVRRALTFPSPSLRPSYRVAIIGAGPAGIGAAVKLASAGVAPVLLIDRAADVGGIPAFYAAKTNGVPTFVVWTRGRVLIGQQFVDHLRRGVEHTNTEVCLESQVIAVDQPTKTVRLVRPGDGLVETRAEAIVFACGAREKSSAERGWIAGARPARQFFTMQLLQWIDGCDALPAERAAIVGSDVIAYSAAAKLAAAGGTSPSMFDVGQHPRARFWERFYFRRWYRPNVYATTDTASIIGEQNTMAIETGQIRTECDGIVLSGELIPNSELIEAAGFPVSRPGRVPLAKRRGELDAPGWFIAGAEAGGFHGAHWCYRNGLRVGARVSEYLRRAGKSGVSI